MVRLRTLRLLKVAGVTTALTLAIAGVFALRLWPPPIKPLVMVYPSFHCPTLRCYEWTDATGWVGWTPMNIMLPPTRVLSCGMLISETPFGVYLAQDVNTGNDMNGVGFIPKSIIYKTYPIDAGWCNGSIPGP